MDTNTFITTVLNRFSQEITDEVFLMIQNDRELMHMYLTLISKNDQGSVNRSLGKAVKARYGLDNLPTREDNPRSSLIKSHQEF